MNIREMEIANFKKVLMALYDFIKDNTDSEQYFINEINGIVDNLSLLGCLSLVGLLTKPIDIIDDKGSITLNTNNIAIFVKNICNKFDSLKELNQISNLH